MSDDDIYAGSYLSKFFGILAFIALLFAIDGLLRLDWRQVVNSLIIFLLFGYVGYRCAGGYRNPNLYKQEREVDFVKGRNGTWYCRNPNLYKQEKEGRKLWSQFRGMANTDDVLMEKAKALAPILVDLINEDTKSLFEELKEDKERKIDDEKFGEVFFEMVLFNLHYLDRIAFQHLGAEKRNVFMDTLIIEFSKALERVDVSGIDVAQFRSSFVETYDERGQEYEKYEKSFPEKNESPKDTLFWEFEKKIALILGSEKDIFVMMRVGNHTFTKYMYLELPELFSEENK